MADLKNVMGVSASDIKNIMGVAVADIKSVVGLEFPAGFLAYQGGTAFFISGYGNASDSLITADVFTLSVTSTGDATDVGDLSEEFGYGSAVGSNVSNGNRIVVGGGQNGGVSNMMHYFTPASYSGGSTDYADLAQNKTYAGSASNGTIGMIGMGWSAWFTNQVDYFTISSTSNAADFGDSVQWGTSPSGSQSLTKAFFSGSYYNGAYNNVISTFTFASPGNATDSGNLTSVRGGSSSTSGSTEARVIVSIGGRGGTGGSVGDIFATEINYMNPASPGDATDFGDSEAANVSGVPGNGTRMVWGGGTSGTGAASATYWEDIHYIDIASTGNATESSGTLPHRKQSAGGWTA